MVSQNATWPQAERRKPPVKDQPKDYGWTLYLLVITLLLVSGFFVSYRHLYEPGDDVGYNLGLAGGLLTLSLLIYPLRKYIHFMRNWGKQPKWFWWHMAVGVLGPTLIMFHSTFQIRSVNAGVALVCMMLASGSGIFGRFFYTKVHYGLYGRQISYRQLEQDLIGSEGAKSLLSFAPGIQQRLKDFHDRAIRHTGIWNFLTVGIRARLFARSIIRELEDAMYADANEKQWSDIQMKRLDQLFFQNEKTIRAYILAVRDLSQFAIYEILFGWWHIFHVPMVFLVVPSGIWHVIAVHKY
ncbi:MAG: hypothetical protein WAW02_10735 [Sideroxyarcus sp.]